MNVTDMVGLSAGAFVVAAFYTTSPVPFRLTALASNLLFIAYGVLAMLGPVVLLHVMLLFLNGVRLGQVLMVARADAGLLPRQI